MPAIDLPPLADVATESARLELAATPSELHGAICGWLAGGGSAGPGWLRRVMADEAAPEPAADGALEQLCKASAAQLADREFAFALLLPDGDAPLAERSGALFDWCNGFLGAFGMAAGAQPPLSAEGREALDDLAKLAAAEPQTESGNDNDQQEEQALAEIEEYVRVATLLLHGDCVLAADGSKRNGNRGRGRQSLH